jgi:hypothetical protein
MIRLNANGALQPSLGQRPRAFISVKTTSAESAIHRVESRFQRWLCLLPDTWGDAPG